MRKGVRFEIWGLVGFELELEKDVTLTKLTKAHSGMSLQT